MSKRVRQLGPNAAVGCLLFFALPLLAFGVGMTWKNYHTLAEHRDMSGWVEVPAKITAVNLHGKRLAASYNYELRGQPFTGDRVLYDESLQDVGGVDRLAYSELKRHADNGQPFRAFVNPRDPSEAVLYRQLRWQPLALFATFAALFGSVGAGLLAAAVAHRRYAPRQTPVEPTDKPWRMRSDWASRQLAPKASTWVAPAVLGAITAWWWLATWPLVACLPQFFAEQTSPWLYVTLLFPLVGVAVFFALVYRWIRAWKYGDSTFEMAGDTGVIGGQLAGVVRIPAVIEAPDGFRARLSALEQVRDRDDTHTVARWQDERLIAKPLADPSGRATAVPILFAIPHTAPPSSDLNSEREIQWELELTAATAGVDYHAAFVVPVFKTADSRADFELDRSLADQYAPPPDSQRVVRDAGLRLEPSPGGGTRLIIPMARNWGTALVVTLVVVGMLTGAGAMFHFGVFMLWPILLVLFALVFAYVALDLWFYRSTVDASPDGLTVRGGFLGLGRTHRIAPNEFQRFKAKEYMSSGREVWSTISVKPRNRPRVTIAKGIHGKVLERAIIAVLESALGRDSE